MYGSTPERLLGTQFLCAVAGAFSRSGSRRSPAAALRCCSSPPSAPPCSAGSCRCSSSTRGKEAPREIERGLPDLIDLLVVTLEAA
jgi:hypothetical protein